jgi:outer membrane protein TolC
MASPAYRSLAVLAAGLLALLACACARADTPLSLAELSDFALRNNPSTRAAWFNATVDMAGTDAARALLQPNLSLTVPLTFQRGLGGGGAASGSSDVTRSLAPSLGLTWVLFDFGARASGVEAARWQAAASQLGYDRAMQSVVNQVEQAYYGLLGARQLQAALQLGVTATRASLDVAQARRSAGLATVGETALAEAAWAQASLQWVRAQAGTRSAEGSLANALGLPVNTLLNVADDDLRPLPANAPDGSRIDALLATARTSRADLLALNAAVQQGQAQLAAAEVQGWPQLALSAQAGRRWGSDGNNGNTQELALTLTMPLFDGGLLRAQTRAAQARVELLTAQRDQQSQVVDLDVWQSFQNADSADVVIDSAQALLRSATQAEDAARERYSVGVGSLLELIVAQSTAAQARVSAVQARYDARLAVARLGYAVGARTAATAPTAPN